MPTDCSRSPPRPAGSRTARSITTGSSSTTAARIAPAAARARHRPVRLLRRLARSSRDATEQSPQPAAVIRHDGGQLVACDPGGETATFAEPDAPDKLPPNNRLVIYELPTAWALDSTPQRARPRDRDVPRRRCAGRRAASEARISPACPCSARAGPISADLGVNALELLPPADSFYKREWGYGTSHYLAPDHDLGYPEGNLSPTANRDLARLVDACHRKGIRFFVDVVMGFAKEEPYKSIDARRFLYRRSGADPDDPDALTSGRAATDVAKSATALAARFVRYAKPSPRTTRSPGRCGRLAGAAADARRSRCGGCSDFRVDGIRHRQRRERRQLGFRAGVQGSRPRAVAGALERRRARCRATGPTARFLVVGEELDAAVRAAAAEPPRRAVERATSSAACARPSWARAWTAKTSSRRSARPSTAGTAASPTAPRPSTTSPSTTSKASGKSGCSPCCARLPRGADREAHQAGLRVPADRGRHPDDARGRGVCRPARSLRPGRAREPGRRQAGRPGQLLAG